MLQRIQSVTQLGSRQKLVMFQKSVLQTVGKKRTSEFSLSGIFRPSSFFFALFFIIFYDLNF